MGDNGRSRFDCFMLPIGVGRLAVGVAPGIAQPLAPHFVSQPGPVGRVKDHVDPFAMIVRQTQANQVPGVGIGIETIGVAPEVM